MDGRTRWIGRRAVCRLAALLLVLQAALAGCETVGPDGGGRADSVAVQQLLDRWAAAVRGHDERAYADAVDPAPEAGAYRDRRRQVYENLADVPFASWDYRVARLGGFAPAAGSGHRVAVEARLRYRLAGYDAAPVTVPVRLTAVRRDGRWYVAGDDTASGDRQLWEQGRVTVVRGAHGLVLGAGQQADLLRSVAALVDAAVPAVGAAWKDGPFDRVVVEMPASLERMGALLGAPASDYRGIAAVTTGDGTGTPARIVVNPEAYGALGDFGRRTVLTHEATHVATRDSTPRAMPMWLSEGFADWVAYRGSRRTPRQVAPELARSVASSGAPRGLPADADFGFTGEPGRLARAYEGGWLACRMVAERWGEGRLVDFYRAVGAKRGSVERGLSDVLGVSVQEFTERWRAYAGKVLRG
ncbi:basic secretory family protein [Streptomyces sp. AV19]|uniref:basic secretory family protein n=1 Tax=Streptomyces sp. AV19 TaxID=2793068 RepID=UPI001F1F1AB2|nr:basic secretory family protein [Streptomyces sp. AV19]MDG4532241.1 basic secretory family protein [Streptomyces sp. AV19]